LAGDVEEALMCKRCGEREAIPGHRMDWCAVCEAWRLAMIERFK
jgi:hypothetical protein